MALVLISCLITPPNSAPSPLPKCPTPASTTSNSSYSTRIQTACHPPTSLAFPNKCTHTMTASSPSPSPRSRRPQLLPRASILMIPAAIIRSLVVQARLVRPCRGRRRSRPRKRRRCCWRASRSTMIVVHLGSGLRGLYREVPGMVIVARRMIAWRGRMIS